MMKARQLLFTAIVSVVTLVMSGASAAGSDVSTPPRTSGPLVSSSFGCDGLESGGSDGRLGRSCYWSYSLLPAETDADEDFSALWIQMEIDPGKNFCATHLGFEVSAPSDGRIVSGVPGDSQKLRGSKMTVTELIVDGDGTAPIPGTIAQDVRERPGRTTVKVSEDRYSFLWRGKSRKPVMVAIGVQMSHGALPPELISLQSVTEFFGTGPCS